MRPVRLLVVPALFAGSVVLAQTETPPVTPSSSAPSATAAEPTAATRTPARTPTPYVLAVQEGIAKLREGQALAAQLAFQRAIAADANVSEAHYYLGVAQFRNGSQTHAVETFRTALRVAQQTNDLFGQGRALYAIAESLEHVHGRGRHADPRTAWQELLTFAEQNPTVVSPELPRSHIASHARIAELEAANQPVRHRIHEREREASRGGHR